MLFDSFLRIFERQIVDCAQDLRPACVSDPISNVTACCQERLDSVK